MIEKSGDLFTTAAQALGHGVNVYGRMGAGIAKEFRIKFPYMYEHYRLRCAEGRLQPGEVYPYEHGTGRFVYNMASQSLPGKYARLEWLESAASQSAHHAIDNGIDTIAIPRIGCGIGGLDWEDVKKVLEKVESTTGITFEVWTL